MLFGAFVQRPRTLAFHAGNTGSNPVRPTPHRSLFGVRTLRANRSLVTVVACCWIGCADSGGDRCRAVPEGDRFELVAHTLWQLTGAEEPWRALRPVGLDCPADAAKVEDFGGRLTWGVDTARCGHATSVQPLLQDACAGEKLFVWFWRDALTGPEGAASTVAVQIGDELIYEMETPIPAPPALIAVTAEIAEDHRTGEPIYFHVHNHGANSYQLLELSRCVGDCTVPP